MIKNKVIIVISLLFLGLTTSPFQIQAAEDRVHTTADSLLARIQVEDFINDYYWELASEGVGDLASFWAEDAIFDVNGNILNGLQAIEDVYALGLGPGGRLIFQMGIPKIRIEGERAIVDLIYTGVLNTDPASAPKLYEQGHDHMELSKSSGEWKITKRILRSISLDQSYGD